ncbi:MAG: peptidylprolyl isomerase [Burkholderiaceae bacterium]|nr:peptidylprolyl isomerase [Burkholderiaceae bacterium]
MLNRNSKALTVAALIVSLAISACSKNADKGVAQAATKEDKTKAALTVNETVVTQGELDMIMRQQPGEREQPGARQHVIDNLELKILAAQDADKRGLAKSEEVQDQIALSKIQILSQSYVKDYFANHKPTDEQLKAEYEKIKAESSGNEFHARHILVKTEDEAKAIIAKLNKDPNSFAELNKQSQDPVAKAKGGDLGWFDPKMMVPEFSAAVAKLEKGKFTEEPVKTTFGYHVIMLDDIRPKADSIPPFEQIKPQLAQRVQQEDLTKTLDALKAKAKIEVRS